MPLFACAQSNGPRIQSFACRDVFGKRRRLCWRAHAKGVFMSFGGRLAQVRAIQAWNSERRAWSSAEEFDRGGCAHAGPEDKCAPSSRAVFARGEGGGSGA